MNPALGHGLQRDHCRVGRCKGTTAEETAVKESLQGDWHEYNTLEEITEESMSNFYLKRTYLKQNYPINSLLNPETLNPSI